MRTVGGGVGPGSRSINPKVASAINSGYCVAAPAMLAGAAGQTPIIEKTESTLMK